MYKGAMTPKLVSSREIHAYAYIIIDYVYVLWMKQIKCLLKLVTNSNLIECNVIHIV